MADERLRFNALLRRSIFTRARGEGRRRRRWKQKEKDFSDHECSYLPTRAAVSPTIAESRHMWKVALLLISGKSSVRFISSIYLMPSPYRSQ